MTKELYDDYLKSLGFTLCFGPPFMLGYRGFRLCFDFGSGMTALEKRSTEDGMPDVIFMVSNDCSPKMFKDLKALVDLYYQYNENSSYKEFKKFTKSLQEQ